MDIDSNIVQARDALTTAAAQLTRAMSQAQGADGVILYAWGAEIMDVVASIDAYVRASLAP